MKFEARSQRPALVRALAIAAFVLLALAVAQLPSTAQSPFRIPSAEESAARNVNPPASVPAPALPPSAAPAPAAIQPAPAARPASPPPIIGPSAPQPAAAQPAAVQPMPRPVITNIPAARNISFAPTTGSVGTAQVSLQLSKGNPHAFDVKITADQPFDIASISIQGEGQSWGRYSMLNDPPAATLEFQTANFRFFPSSFQVVAEVDFGGRKVSRSFGPYHNDVQKFIVVDRDNYPQRCLLIEGDRWFLFGRLVASSEVSTGVRKYGGTPLGYYNVRSKEIKAYNAAEEWDMPMAHWYTPANNPEGVNGLHQGFEGTVYGIEQSHGCTRMPEWFTEKIWGWSEIGTPLVMIGNEYITAFDRGRFDLTDYEFFDHMIRDTFLYQQGLQAGREEATYLTPKQAQLVQTMQPLNEQLLDSCAKFLRFTQGAQYNQLMKEFVNSRGSF